MSETSPLLRFAHHNLDPDAGALCKLRAANARRQLGVLTITDRLGLAADSPAIATMLGFEHALSAPIRPTREQRLSDGSRPKLAKALFIASQHPMKELFRHDHALAATIQTPAQEIAIMTMHLDPNDPSLRLRQLGIALSQLRSLSPVILTGNFDPASSQTPATPPQSPWYRAASGYFITPSQPQEPQSTTNDLLEIMHYQRAGNDIHYAQLDVQQQNGEFLANTTLGK